jgi:DNA-directed RNA polymerase beta' subunit
MDILKHLEDPVSSARGHALKALRRGDLEAAERWTKVTERELAIIERLAKLVDLDMKNETRQADLDRDREADEADRRHWLPPL